MFFIAPSKGLASLQLINRGIYNKLKFRLFFYYTFIQGCKKYPIQTIQKINTFNGSIRIKLFKVQYIDYINNFIN